MRRIMYKLIFSSSLIVLLSTLSFADTIVGPDGKAGIATSWKTEGKVVTLTIKDGFSVTDVSEAIVRGVPGAKAESSDGVVKVTGIDEANLIKALARIEVDEALDDIDSAFAAIQNPITGDDGSGSSIRATKHRKLPGIEETPAKPIAELVAYSGQVQTVRHKRFPLVVLNVKTSSGEKLTIIPHIVVKHGIISSNDNTSKKNLAAWYCRVGDQISFKVLNKGKSFWVATDFNRAK